MDFTSSRARWWVTRCWLCAAGVGAEREQEVWALLFSGGLTDPKASPCFLLVNLWLLGLSYLGTVDTGRDRTAEPAGTMFFPATCPTLGCTLETVWNFIVRPSGICNVWVNKCPWG